MTIVLEDSALLALLHDEAGGARVAEALASGAVMGAVNYGEVVAKLSDAGLPEEHVHEPLDGLRLGVVPFDEALAFSAGRLPASTRERGLSLAARACLALGLRLRAPILTADRTCEGLVPDANLTWIR